ncbi:FAD-linked oxidoreductase [Actinorhabdospora filicis]|uniref:FAD-linked oxidoreductase n=1 Tax=Actinorhabdospora filicis TaxID=1785913 RepID=A0A9W6SRE3_9ACTN|nr:D-arabinono-1,4-lactone oxidase [Actinorhabdospora filicis]GLZ81539.1 FAD-linked oxidoreductase [Actinorhabdospora filicis]
MSAWRNWSGGVRANPARVVAPATTGEVVDAVRAAAREGLRVKPVGAGHSFTSIAATDGVQLRADRLNRVVDVDRDSGLVTVEGGISLYELGPLLHRHGLAMENLGDIDRQSISGAVSTGTHGTGAAIGTIATQIRAMQLVLADGEVVDCSADERPELFAAARVGLGALGVITRVTLQCVPAFALHGVEEPLPIDEVLDGMDELADTHDHWEFFWFPHGRTALTKRHTRLPGDAPLKPIGRLRHIIDDEILSNGALGAIMLTGTAIPATIPPLTRLAGRALSRREYVDTSYKVFASTRRVRFFEGEYAIPREAAAEVLREIRHWVDTHDERVSFPFEVRYVAGDDIPLAPTYGRDSVYIAFHQYRRMPYRRFFDAMEDILGAAGGRPHWGKLHRLDAAALREKYPRFTEFTALRDTLDPGRLFTNDYLDRVLGAP